MGMIEGLRIASEITFLALNPPLERISPPLAPTLQKASPIRVTDNPSCRVVVEGTKGYFLCYPHNPAYEDGIAPNLTFYLKGEKIIITRNQDSSSSTNPKR